MGRKEKEMRDEGGEREREGEKKRLLNICIICEDHVWGRNKFRFN